MTDAASALSTSASAPDAPPSPLAAVVVDQATKRYGQGAGAVHALDRVSLDVRAGEFVCLVGASGCGKSTLLNLVAGLDRPTSGRVEARGHVTLMFQEAALFPWLSVAGNISLALKLKGIPKRERKGRVDALLEQVKL